MTTRDPLLFRSSHSSDGIGQVDSSFMRFSLKISPAQKPKGFPHCSCTFVPGPEWALGVSGRAGWACSRLFGAGRICIAGSNPGQVPLSVPELKKISILDLNRTAAPKLQWFHWFVGHLIFGESYEFSNQPSCELF